MQGDCLMDNVPASDLDPNVMRSPVLMMQRILEKWQLKIECSIPAIVQSYDADANLVEVIPAVNMVLATLDQFGKNEVAQRAAVVVPVYRPQGGGFFSYHPLNAGDTGRLIASDVNTDNFNQTKNVSNPNTYLTHQYAYGLFIPDGINNDLLSDDDKEKYVLSNSDGSVKLTMENGQFVITGNFVINGNLSVNGAISASGDVTSGSISLTGHTHGGVSRGSGRTDAPQ